MDVQEAQGEMRQVYLGGAIGQMVSGVIWLISAVLGTWVSVNAGVLSLFFGGMFIFSLTQLALKALGRPAALGANNPLYGLGRTVALVAPLCLPVIYAAARFNVNWYYPAFLVVVGAHYLPFTFLYGTRAYLLLSGLMIAGGCAIAMLLPKLFVPGAWFGGILLVVFALYLFRETSGDAKARQEIPVS